MIADLMRAVQQMRPGLLAVPAFLDLSEPDLTAAVTALQADQGIDPGIDEAVVLPLLFTEAFHATVDVPQAVRQAAEQSGLELVTADILGTGDDMLDVVRQSMVQAGIGDTESVLLLSVGSSSEAANDAIADLATRIAVARRGAVRAAFGTRSPRAVEVLEQLPHPRAIVPLFLSPGLLLDPLAALAAERQMVMAPPLGDLVAPLLVQRYRQARARIGA